MTPGRALIISPTSGIGFALAAEALQRGYKLALAGRNKEEVSRRAAELERRFQTEAIPCIAFDARDSQTHGEFFREVLSVCGPIDVCVLSFGVMPSQDDAMADWKLCNELILCNYAGPVALLNIVSEYFATRRQGIISCITSVAGDRGRSSNFLYGSTKAALNVFLAGLRQKLYRYGVTVQTVKAGPVDTPMAAKSAHAPFMVSPEYAASAIWSAIEKRRDVVYVPWFWRYIMWAVRSVPEPLFKRLTL